LNAFSIWRTAVNRIKGFSFVKGLKPVFFFMGLVNNVMVIINLRQKFQAFY
jgi:hypothetical protein